jgi:hypothetical protein
VEDAQGNRRYGKMSDDLSISFIGPVFSTRLLDQHKRNAFISNISIGYMGYYNDKLLIDPVKMTGSTLGVSVDFGYDIRISEKVSLGIQLSLVSGSLSEYSWDDGITKKTIELEPGEFESLNRIDLSLGLRFGR